MAFEPPLAVGAGSAIDRRHFIGVATVAIREPAAAAVLDSSMFDYIPRRFPNIQWRALNAPYGQRVVHQVHLKRGSTS